MDSQEQPTHVSDADVTEMKAAHNGKADTTVRKVYAAETRISLKEAEDRFKNISARTLHRFISEGRLDSAWKGRGSHGIQWYVSYLELRELGYEDTVEDETALVPTGPDPQALMRQLIESLENGTSNAVAGNLQLQGNVLMGHQEKQTASILAAIQTVATAIEQTAQVSDLENKLREKDEEIERLRKRGLLQRVFNR